MPPKIITWNHYNPVCITAGPEAMSRLPELLPGNGHLLLVTSQGFTRRGMTTKISAQLGHDRVVIQDRTAPNPDLDDLDRIAGTYQAYEFSAIIGLGGGSVLDAAKVLGAILADKQEQPLDLALRQGKGLKSMTRIPVTAIPTTAGTGAEVTPFATVWDKEKGQKHSLAGEMVWPAQALLDPCLLLSLPRQESLHTGLDTISHALESLWNTNRNPVSEAWALHSLQMANKALPLIMEYPENLEERSRMQQASLLAGLAISQTRTALAHSISYPLTIHYGVPHGLACSFTLPGLIRKYIAGVNPGHERRIIEETLSTLHQVGLEQEAARFLQDKDLQAYAPEMFNPDRAGNFILQMRREDVEELLKASIAP